jgi:hypothetical protein
MVRADYGGDGQTATRDGEPVAACDPSGVIPCPDGARIEAAWSPDGATCVARARVPEIADLDDLASRYPRLAMRLGPPCTTEAARADPRAVLYSLIR